MHLVNEFPYVRTLCGLPLDQVGEDWTDAVYEVAKDPQGACSRCLAQGRKVVARTEIEDRREIAMEAGMLHGIEAYNEAMGY